MKTTYIYLNTYTNGYLYVGSHTWDGPEGVLDPNYHGSSHVAKRYKWSPIKEEILEVVSPERKFIAEHYWIELYAKRVGIAKCAIAVDGGKNTRFTERFAHGLLLNMHSNAGEQLLNAAKLHWRESHETRLRNGAFQRFLESKRVMTHEEYLEVAKRRNYKESAAKQSQTLRNNVTRLYHSVRVTYKSQYIGTYKSVTKACKELGVFSWTVMLNRRLRKSDSVEREGYLFEKV